MTSPYVMRPTRIAYIEVLGTVWMPAGQAANRYELSDFDLSNIGDFTRENVSNWLDTHSGDFRSVTDFNAICGATETGWEDPENEFVFGSCMFPEDDD